MKEKKSGNQGVGGSLIESPDRNSESFNSDPKPVELDGGVLIEKDGRLKPKRSAREIKPRQPKKAEMVTVKGSEEGVETEEEEPPLAMNEIVRIDDKLKYHNLHVQGLIRSGEIKRISRGVYVTAEMEASKHEKAATMVDKVAEIFKNNRRVMTIDEILSLFNETYRKKINRDSLRTCIYTLKKEGVIKRLDYGIYAAAELG